MRLAGNVLLTLALVIACYGDTHPHHWVSQSRRLLTLSAPPVTRGSRFAPISAQCSIFQGPKLISGDPSILPSGTEDIVVDLIVATNGKVQNPIVVTGTNVKAHAVLETMGKWRYRPALCDGVPIDAEGQITLTQGPNTTAGNR